MNYFNYAIKCVIRNIIYKLMKPKTLIIIITSLIIILLLSKYTTVFGWEGNDDYTDKNTTIKMMYDSINQDLVNRIKYFSGNDTNITNLINCIKDQDYNYYVFYGGNTDGSSMVSQTFFNTNELYIYFYLRDNPNSSASINELYQGMTTSFRNITGGFVQGFVFTGSQISTFTPQSFTVPTVLMSYKSPILYDFVNDTSQQQTNGIVAELQAQTQQIIAQNQIEQATQDFVTDDSITSSNMSVNTTGMTVTDSNNIFGFLSGFLTNLKNFFSNISDDVQIIEIPMPNNMDSIYLRSDIVSSHIQGTFLYTFIQTLWYFVFGTYLLFYIKHLINFFSTGEFAYTGLAVFLEHLENEDVIIRSTMM